jgi:hypothetical protein
MYTPSIGTLEGNQISLLSLTGPRNLILFSAGKNFQQTVSCFPRIII